LAGAARDRRDHRRSKRRRFMANESNVDEILKMASEQGTKLDEILKMLDKMISEQTAQVMNTQPILGYIILGLAAVVLVLIAAVIIVMLFKGTARDRIAGLMFEVGADGQRGKPSVSRLQMLIWNFVVAFAFLYLLGTRGNVYASIQALFQWQVLQPTKQRLLVLGHRAHSR